MKMKILSLLCPLLLVSVSLSAQDDRAYIKEQIELWGSCRNVALSDQQGNVALSGYNVYAASGVLSNLSATLKQLSDAGEYIDDVQLTEAGRWLVLYGDNGFRWNDIPSDLERTLREYNSDQEVITSVTFNDNGGWIVISREHISASTSDVYDWIKEGIDQYGQLWAAHLTNDGLVLCYERGYKFTGDVPDVLKQKLRETSIDVYRIKFLSDGAYFIADNEGHYSYYM